MNVWVCKKQDAVCANCRYFHQHYVLDERGVFWKCDAGHCVYPRTKNREPRDGCQYFALKPGPAFYPAAEKVNTEKGKNWTKKTPPPVTANE